MFTGIVTAVGSIERIEQRADGVRIEVAVNGLPLDDVAVGDSIALSGVCLTVIDKTAQQCSFDVSAETLRCTVGLQQQGGAVNLEKAMRLADRIGGHLVTGHVDGIGTVLAFTQQGEHWLLRIDAPSTLARLIARKGSIAVNGVSLTVNQANGTQFEVNLIPHTLAQTNLRDLMAGSKVNLEVDLIARYVERMLSGAE